MYLVYSTSTDVFRPSEEDLPRYIKREHHSEPLSAACNMTILMVVLAALGGNKQRGLWIFSKSNTYSKVGFRGKPYIF